MKRFLLGVIIGFAGSWLSAAPIYPADFDWTVTKQMKLEASPLDVAPSADGQWLFILAQGEILVYSTKEDKVVKQIPVDKAFDRVIHSAVDNTLILSSRSGQTLEMIQMEPVYKIDVSGLPFQGAEKAPVTIAVFSDYQWPYCARLEPLLLQVQEKYPKEVKLVFKNFPIASHKFARKAAIAALAAHAQGKFRQFHDALFKNSSSLNDAAIQQIAADLSLDMEKFNRDMGDPSFDELVAKDVRDGREVGIGAVPAVFINGKVLRNRSMPAIQEMIAAELQKAEKNEGRP